MASMEREQRALIKWCRDTSSRYLGCTEQDMNILCWLWKVILRFICLHRNSSYWELSKSLDKILEMTGRSVITAVVSTCWELKTLAVMFLPAPITVINLPYELTALLTVLGPSTALPGFKAPPAPGFSPKIHTRCLRKRVRRFSTDKDAMSYLVYSTFCIERLPNCA